MLLMERDLLRLHVEAVWGVRLPPLDDDDCELLSTSSQPSWQLYVADIASARVHIWRPDIGVGEREALRLRVDAALAFPPALPPPAGISREVAFAFTALPRLNLESARNIARPLTSQDRSLLDLFQADLPVDLFHPAKRPLIGVINSGRLLCLAHSSRRTNAACELGIDTLPSARRKGYALAATILWTHAVLQEGLVPIYSAFAENTPSLSLAIASGYQPFARGATFERELDL